jgi:hypothetical protein
MVTTICYGKKEVWNSRQDAVDFYRECMMYSEGSERERYTCIYLDLMDGKNVCTDEWD